jgi:hypothetical protein
VTPAPLSRDIHRLGRKPQGGVFRSQLDAAAATLPVPLPPLLLPLTPLLLLLLLVLRELYTWTGTGSCQSSDVPHAVPGR